MSWLERLQQVRKTLKELGYEKERAAAALLALSFFGLIYLLVGLNAPDGWGPAFAGLSLCYLVAFVALASEWFWARWFASGLGWSGFMVGLMSLVMVGVHPTLIIYTGLHAVIVGTLMGPKMAARYDLQPAWRERYAMDEFGVTRLGKAVTRASASLPTLILWALAPRDGDGQLLPVAAGILAALGMVAMLRLRTWGLLVFSGAAGLVVLHTLLGPSVTPLVASFPGRWFLLASAPLAAVWAVAALAPFIRPAWAMLRGR